MDEGGLYKRDTTKLPKQDFTGMVKDSKGVWATRDDGERKVTSNIDGNASTKSVFV